MTELHFDDDLPDDWPRLFDTVLVEVERILGYRCACRSVVATHTHGQERPSGSAKRALHAVAPLFGGRTPDHGDYCSTTHGGEPQQVLFLQYDIICPAHRRSVIAHEYMHVHQQNLMGLTFAHRESPAPMWMMEGCAALFEHLYIIERWPSLLRDAKQWGPLHQAVRAVRHPSEFGLPPTAAGNGSDGFITFGQRHEHWPGSVNYYVETLAVAFLCHTCELWGRSEVLFTAFYRRLGSALRRGGGADAWRAVFTETFGLSVEAFYARFNAFVRMPLSDQYGILPTGARVLRDHFTPEDVRRALEVAMGARPPKPVRVGASLGIRGRHVALCLTIDAR